MNRQLVITKDKGYAWFAALGMIVVYLFGLGVSSYGNLPVLVYVWIDELQITAQQAGLASSLISAVIFIPGPVYSLVIHAVGCWKGQMVATGFLLAGYITVAYSQQLWHIMVGYSLLTGLGAAIAQVTTVVALEDYFHVHKDKVWTLAIAAYSAGLIVGPPLLEFLVRNLGYKLALLIESGIVSFLNLMVAFIFSGNRLSLSCQPASENSQTEVNFSDGDQPAGCELTNNNTDEVFSIDKQLTLQQKLSKDNSEQHHSLTFKSRLLNSLRHQKEIIKSPAFALLLLYHVFISIGEIICLTYVVELAVQSGYATPSQAAFGPMLNGISSVITSIAMAVFANYNKNSLVSSMVFAFILGISIFSLPFSTYLPVYYTLNFVFGIGEAGYISSMMFNISYLFGEDETAVHRMAYMFLATGVGFLLGPLVVGDAIRVQGSTDIAFYVGGAASFSSGLFLIPLIVNICLRDRRRSRETETN